MLNNYFSKLTVLSSEKSMIEIPHSFKLQYLETETFVVGRNNEYSADAAMKTVQLTSNRIDVCSEILLLFQ